MTIGKLYYLANVLGGLDDVLWIIALIIGLAFITLFIVTTIMLSDYAFDDEEMVPLKKYLKIIGLAFIGVSLLAVLIPSKEDFLIISLTKDYRQEQVYNMSKEELKSGIDYIIEKLKEVEE